MLAFVIAKELCTGTNGDAISNRTPDCGFGAWKNGVGLFALGASIQSNKIARTSIGSAGTVQHNMLNASGFPTDLLNYCWDLGRPGDVASQQLGFFFRGTDTTFNGTGNDAIYISILRVSSTLVDVRVLGQLNGVNGQQSTRASNVAWAASEEKCLGITINGASLQVWIAPALASRAGVIPTVAERTNQGSALTLTPDVFNDNDHRVYGAFAVCGVDPYQYTWDNGYVWVDNPTPVSNITVVRTSRTVRTLSWPAKTGLGAITYDVAYSLNDGLTWTTLATDQAGTSYEWTTTALRADFALVKVRYGNGCQNGPWRLSPPFEIGT